jgi:uncharacterized protein (TIGR03437 family)
MFNKKSLFIPAILTISRTRLTSLMTGSGKSLQAALALGGQKPLWRSPVMLAVCTAALFAQAPPVSTLVVDTSNRVVYQYDSYDVPKFGTSATAVPSQGIRTDHPFIEEASFADVVSVNGRPVMGNMVIKSVSALNMNPIPGAGRAIGDITRLAYGQSAWEILTADGRQVGTIMTNWLSGGTPPPGAPSVCTAGNQAVVGGTGAFLGVRGFVCQAPAPTVIASRSASVQEDPQSRRKNGGGTNRYVMQLIPTFWPAIVISPNGPAVVHASDSSLVTTANPAKAGELLSLYATGLGPTIPGVDPGQPFPASPPSVVSSPVTVTVNGTDAEVLYAGGYPGSVDGYQVNFRLPATTTGPSLIQVSAAWIKGPAMNIPVR